MKIEYTKTGRVLLSMSNIIAAAIFTAIGTYLWLFIVTTYVLWGDVLNNLQVYVEVLDSPLIRETLAYSMLRSFSWLSLIWLVMGNMFDINHLKFIFFRNFRVKDGTLGW